MKVKIEFDASLTENEIIIRYCSLNEEIQKLQETVSDIALTSKKFVCYQSDREFFIPLDDILFFETDAGRMHVHTAAEAYDTKFKLYELEEALPRSFGGASQVFYAGLQIYDLKHPSCVFDHKKPDRLKHRRIRRHA